LAGAMSIALLANAVGMAAPADAVRVESLDGQAVDPLQAVAGVTASAFTFVSVECPVSNRYAPAVKPLAETLSAPAVRFTRVDPNPAESAAAIRDHVAAFGYQLSALRDPRHALVKHAQVTITPEAAVFTAKGALAYRGRIDDRYVSLGLERPAATVH